MLSKRKTPPRKPFKCQAKLVSAYTSNAQYHKPEATRPGLHGHFASYFFAPFPFAIRFACCCGSKPEHGNADGFMLAFFSLRNCSICTWEIIPFKLNWVISCSVTACAVCVHGVFIMLGAKLIQLRYLFWLLREVRDREKLILLLK